MKKILIFLLSVCSLVSFGQTTNVFTGIEFKNAKAADSSRLGKQWYNPTIGDFRLYNGTGIHSFLHGGANKLSENLSFDGAFSVVFGQSTTLSSFNVKANTFKFLPSIAPVVGQIPTATNIDGSWTWQNGFANPMTNVGDLIRGGAAGVATRLAAVATGSVLGSAGINTTPAYLAVSNGLTATGTTFKLGGALTGQTNFTGSAQISFQSSGGIANYSSYSTPSIPVDASSGHLDITFDDGAVSSGRFSTGNGFGAGDFIATSYETTGLSGNFLDLTLNGGVLDISTVNGAPIKSRLNITDAGVFRFLPTVAPVVGQVITATNVDGTWTWQNASGGGSGTVTSVTSADANATVATTTTTPVITIVAAPKLATARTINGTSFDGTANITVTADANTLTNTILKSTVLASSLTSVGTLTGGATGAGFTVALGSSTITGRLAFANLTQIAARSVLGVTGSSTADVAAITASADGQFLNRAGGTLGFTALFPLSSSQLQINNPAATFAYTIISQAIAANRNLYLPLTIATDTLVTKTDIANASFTIPLLEIYGGTHQATYNTGDILQATAANTLSTLASVAAGNALISGGVTTASSWGKIGLTTHVSGRLPFANLTQIAGLSVLGVTAGSTADVAAITAGSDHQVLIRASSSSLAFATLGTADLPSAYWLYASGGTLTGANVITGSTSNTVEWDFASLGTSVTIGAGASYVNGTAAAIGAQQISPIINLDGHGWATTGSVSRLVRAYMYELPIQSTTPTGRFVMGHTINATTNDNFYFESTGRFAATSDGGTTLMEIVPSSGVINAATNNLVLQTNGTNRISLSSVGVFTQTKSVASSGNSTFVKWTAPANTAQTLNTEESAFIFDGSATLQFATGSTIGTQRLMWIKGQTIGFVGASTLANSYTLYVDNPLQGTNATLTNTYALGLSGNLSLATAGNKIFIKEGSNASLGQTTLVSGTKAITVTGTTTSTRCLTQLVTPNTATLTVEYQCVCTANTVTIQANLAATTINTADASVINYFLVEPTP